MQNTLVIADTHGSAPGLRDILLRAGAAKEVDGDLHRNPGWRIIHVGDLANMAPHGKSYRGFESEDHNVLKIAHDLNFDDVIPGNHEIYYTHNLRYTGDWAGMARRMSQLHPDTMNYINKMAWKGQYTAASAANGYLITHAGVHPSFQGSLPDDPEEAAEELNERLMGIATKEIANADRHPEIVNVGRSSGGRDPVGGIFWLRPGEGESHDWNNTKFHQIVGHTPSESHPFWDENERMYYIDSGSYVKGTGTGLVWRDGDQGWTPL